jgi:sulfite reductase alpha subunit-like flavoprotein
MPLPPGQGAIPDNVALPLRFPLVFNPTGTQPNGPGADPMSGPGYHCLPVPGGWRATLISNHRTTPPEYSQDVRRLTFDLLPGPDGINLDPEPCDTMTIFPKNRPEEVQKLVDWMGWSSEADTPINRTLTRLPPNLNASPTFTLRDLLLHSLDITAVPKRAFLKRISNFSSDPAHRERLLEFTMPDYLDDYYDYTTRPRRTTLEVLEEFSSVRIPASAALDVFPLIRGREFSIASGGALLDHPTNPSLRRIDLLVALVRYKTILRRERTGLCSRYLESLPVNTTLTVLPRRTLTPLHGPQNALRPLLAIATGTGIAPLRSLFYERATHGNPAPSHLFFGFRDRAADFHFQQEWPNMPGLVVHPAESRPKDGTKRAYVQDVLAQEAKTVVEMVRKGTVVFVCGGSHVMARGVRDVVREVVEKETALSKEEVEGVVGSLQWVQEIW